MTMIWYGAYASYAVELTP